MKEMLDQDSRQFKVEHSTALEEVVDGLMNVEILFENSYILPDFVVEPLGASPKFIWYR